MTLSGYEFIAHDLGNEPLVRLNAFGIERVMHIGAPPFSPDQPGLAQNAQMLGNSRLGHIQFFGQSTHAEEGLAVTPAAAKYHGLIGKQFEQPQTGRVGQGLEDIRQCFDFRRHISIY